MKKVNIDSENCIIKPSIYKKSGKTIIVEFDKCFETSRPELNTFIVSRAAYAKKIDEICRYANVFFKYYDEDKEFLSGLLSIKYQIDDVSNPYPLMQFISDIMEYLFTDNVIKKIFKMVDDYYEIDLTPTAEVKNIDLHALQFMNEHGKALMALAIAYKLTIPVVCHYYTMCPDKVSEYCTGDSDESYNIKKYLYLVFSSYFPLFQGDSDLYAKIAATVNSHLTDTKNSDKLLWRRQINKKMTPIRYMEPLISTVIVDLIPKSIFKKNLIYLFQVAIRQQIKSMLLGKDRWDYCEISTKSGSDELSGLEKIETNGAMISDLDIILSKVNIKKSIKRIAKKYGVKIDPKEVEYYKEHLHTYQFSNIIEQFFARDFGGTYDLKNIGRGQYIRLMIIFKKLMSELGFFYLQHILTGNLSKSIKKRNISVKQLKRIEQSPRFQALIKNYSDVLSEDNTCEFILNHIAMLINTPVEFVDYADQAHYGTDIKVDVDIVVDEYIRFLYMI